MLKQNSSDKPFENGWLARLKLLFRQRHGESIMADNTHIGPLRVQRTFKAEDESRHVYILHPPGGYVAGDLIDIHVETQDSSHVVVTSPGASKFYRCEPGNPNKQTQTLNLRAKQHSLLEWLPPETIFFKDANAHLETNIQLDANSDFIGWGERLASFQELMASAWRTRGIGDFWSHMLVAEGAVDVAAEPSLAVWDMAALDIIVREAGGRFTNVAGSDGSLGGSGLSTNSKIHQQIVNKLNGH